jgi:hypothetical protein
LTIAHTIDREIIHVGDPVELVITAVYPTNGIVQLPEIGREKDLVLLKRDWAHESLNGGHTKTSTRYSLTSFRLGEHVITTNDIIYTANETTETHAFPNITLKVETSLPANASTEITDIKPVHKLPGRVPPWLWISVLVALLAFLVGLLTSRKLKNRSIEKPAPPPIPPHIVALQALEALKNMGLLEKDECNPFYTELSLILRTYLEGRFNLNAPDETTEEIVEEMSRSAELNGTQRNILQDFMRQADMVKFAKGRLGRSTMESAFETTRQFVEQTKKLDDMATRERKEHIGKTE